MLGGGGSLDCGWNPQKRMCGVGVRLLTSSETTVPEPNDIRLP